MKRHIEPKAVIAPQSHVLVKNGVKYAGFRVIDPLPVRNLVTVKVAA